MFKTLLLLILPLLGGCDLSLMNNEAVNKSEYSVLQYYAYEYREAKHDKPYMIFKHALKTELTVLAFPIKDKPVGYVVILARAEGVPKVKVITEVDFEVTKDAYAAVKAETVLSKEVDQFIAVRVR
jgi:hypothetical protein